MPSATASKKEIIDFLWEWANSHGDWGKLLVDAVVKTETALDPAERENIFDRFLDSLRQTKKMPAVAVAKPVYRPVAKVVELGCLRDITGVNKLAKNQQLRFSKNMTVVYGENGTGKTGYGRILKTFGFSYDHRNTIHPNIYGTSELRTAVIEFTVDGNGEVFDWNGNNTHTDLTTISVFNSNCVQISLGDRQLIVSPIGFHLFSLVTGELQELTVLLRAKIAAHSTEIDWFDRLHDGTPQFTFISQLGQKSSEDVSTALSAWDAEHERQLEEKEKSLTNLNAELLHTQINGLNAQLVELGTILNKITASQTICSDKQLQDLITLNEQIIALENKTQVGLKEIAEVNGVRLFESVEFNKFIKAADTYLKILDQSTYPGPGDRCLYCNQPLEDSAAELLANYKRLLNDTTQQDIQRLSREREALIGPIRNIDASLEIHHPIIGRDADGGVLQPPELVAYNDRLSEMKAAMTANLVTRDTRFNVDYVGILSWVRAVRSRLEKDLTTKKTDLASIVEQAAKLTAGINELKDRKWLSAKREEVKKVIQNYKIIALLQPQLAEFNTGSLSRKTSEAREVLIQQNFDKLFLRELAALRKAHIGIQLSFGTERGNSKLTQRMKSYYLSDILSEGEQKAIALAEFLTELQLDLSRSPVIFDDPVNSLDHRIIDEVAKRLIQLSKTRQVIILTHSILLMNSLIQQSELATNKDNTFKAYSLRNNFDETGFLEEYAEVNSFGYYKKKVEAAVNGKRSGADEEKLAREGYGHLRAAIEVAVEQDILAKTIVRHGSGVAFPGLVRIQGEKLDEHKGSLNDIYEKCCKSIDGHSSSPVVHTTPTINELKADLDAFLKIRTHFI
jgi:recombinational DNA repair ATPase RecF